MSPHPIGPLVDLVLRASLIVLAGLATVACLRRRSAALRHGVLAVSLVAAVAIVPLRLVLPSWDLPLARFVSASSFASRLIAMPTSATSTAGDDAGIAAASVRDRSSREARDSRDARRAAGARVVDDSTNASTAGTWSFIGSLAASPLAAIVVIWAIGCAIGAARLFAGLGRLAWIGSRAERVRHGRWTRIASQVARAHHLSRAVTLLQTDTPDLLATWGLFRPRVLLPAHAHAWTDDRIRVVLSHELAHIRRGDWAIQIGAEVLRVVSWFNPLFWIACARLRRESEQACDDEVLRMGVAADDYATHLLEVARTCRRSDPMWASAMPMARASTLERRIAAMLNPRLDRRALSTRALSLIAVLLAGVALPVAALRASQSTPLPLTGTVYDPTGAVLPEVALVLQDAQQHTWNATTDGTGRFEFPAVPAGRYVLQAELRGFRALKHEVMLRDAPNWDRAITLQVGDVQETISVRSSRAAAGTPSTSATTTGSPTLRAGGNIKAPMKMKDVKPIYPQSMLEAGREGVVPIEAVIGQDGIVRTVRVLSAHIHPDFAIAAADAVRQWRYTPTLLNGVPVEVIIKVSVTFSLSD